MTDTFSWYLFSNNIHYIGDTAYGISISKSADLAPCRYNMVMAAVDDYDVALICR